MHPIDHDSPDFAARFAALMAASGVASGLLTPRFLAYRAAYLGGAPCVGLVMTERDAPLFGLRFDVVRDAAGRVAWDAVDVPTAGLVGRGAPAELVGGAIGAGRRALTGLVERLRPATISFLDPPTDGALGDIARWALDLGARVEPRFSQIVDLTAGETAAWRGLTKSFQSSVNWGKRHLVLRVVAGPDGAAAAMEVLHALHLQAAGRETREADTWADQLGMVEADEAFVVVAELDGRPVSAALFHATATDCYYGVSASDRALFDKPISHAVLWQAMTVARARGVSRFELGQQLWPGVPLNGASPSDKELSIARFKRSFGGEAHVRLKIDLAIPPEGPLSGR